MTDYDFERLGSREFEHMSQALAAKLLGPLITTFGDGPDGGREATWDGAVTPLSADSNWDGYGVLQAKFMSRPGKAKENLAWFRSEIHAELDKWAAPVSNRSRKPEFFIIVTNSRLSASPGNGKDAANELVRTAISTKKLPIQAFRIWDYDDLRPFLDDAESIRRRYSAFLTPGDIVASVLDSKQSHAENLATALSVSAALALRDDAPLNLTQTGVMSETGLTIADVFVDLPSEVSSASRRSQSQASARDGVPPTAQLSDADDLIHYRIPSSGEGVASRLITILNRTRSPREEEGVESVSVVVVGGPGQGKSTVTQWLSQLYRVEFLEGNPALRGNRTTRDIAESLRSRAANLQLPKINARRWPFRIILTEFADYMSANPGATLVEYIATRLTTRGSVTVRPSDVLTWLSLYPSVIFADGLDEVPPTSNRTQVLRALSDLAVEADTRSGDLIIVATTRPQGYGDELERFNHIRLQKLSVTAAISCAQALIHVRFGEGTQKSEQVLERLRKASRESATEKLFESPLQVSILTVLLEKLGKAPGDRSRLFSAYYEVISSREQEKSGDLSDLLQRYEADIRTLHREIGNALQRRTEAEGESSATLSLEEFHDAIAAQFRAQGHKEQEISDLRAEFSRLVTDRLVFLTFVVGDRVGFELRSLQEFMAGEYIVSLPEPMIVPEISRIALSAYWRNVTLFAIGSIFAHRAHLRAEVVLICQALNRDLGGGSLFPGSDLAIDILRDGSCLSMPSYTEALAAAAADAVEGPVFADLRDLVALTDARVLKVASARLMQTHPAPSSVWLNRLLARTSVAFPAGLEGLPSLYESLDPEIRRHVARYAWERGDDELASLTDHLIWDARPVDYFDREGGWDSPGDAPGDFGHIVYLGDTNLWDGGNAPALDESLWGSYMPLFEDEPQWRWINEKAPTGGAWDALRSISAFALDPSQSSLASALDALVVSGDPLPGRAPWPLLFCYRAAVHECGAAAHSESALSASLKLIAEMVRSGKLGTLSDWLSCESRSPKAVALDVETIKHLGNNTAFEHVATGTCVPLAARNFATSSSARKEHQEDNLTLLRAILNLTATAKGGLAASHLGGLGLFLLSVMVDDGFELHEHDDLLDWAIDIVSTSQHGEERWWSWTSVLVEEGRSGSIPAVLDIAGRRPRLVRGPRRDISDVLITAYRTDSAHWPQLRLALRGHPRSVEALTDSELTGTPADTSEVSRNLDRVLNLVLALRRAERAFQSAQVEKLVSSDDSLDARWLLQAVQGSSYDASSIGALASAVSLLDPVLGAGFAEAANQIVRSAPAIIDSRAEGRLLGANVSPRRF
ncbi:hypothetical protein [Microbacterium sp. NPDC097977]|uniref:NACHT domain-containing protein n=1 Tax=Microbacterium sp. NPDC097977 TaxID=3155686 RepID=UPI00331B09FC